jgi:hypothetical protein
MRNLAPTSYVCPDTRNTVAEEEKKERKEKILHVSELFFHHTK